MMRYYMCVVSFRNIEENFHDSHYFKKYKRFLFKYDNKDENDYLNLYEQLEDYCRCLYKDKFHCDFAPKENVYFECFNYITSNEAHSQLLKEQGFMFIDLMKEIDRR